MNTSLLSRVLRSAVALLALTGVAACGGGATSSASSSTGMLPAPAGSNGAAEPASQQQQQQQQRWFNDIGPRYQWENNYGYCGEVSFISAGLYYGQYVSQYEARAAASDAPQYEYVSQLLLGGNDARAAKRMHLAAVEWDRSAQRNSRQFLAWVKHKVMLGYPVIIGVYTNDYRFYGDKNRKAGSHEYDHIVPVLGVDADPNEPRYSANDTIIFSDNGVLGPGPKRAPYLFHYRFGPFQRDREQANGPDAPWYSLPDYGKNYGAAVTGVIDQDNETVPVRVSTSANDEIPEIRRGSNKRPAPDPLTLTVTVSGLRDGEKYVLYRYSGLDSIPDRAFNAHAAQASEHWGFRGTPSGSFAITEHIMTDDVAAYRAVPANAP